jgi:Uma2 family endonuclease
MQLANRTIPTAQPAVPPIHYPESDGKPIAENTKQFEYIVSLFNGFQALYEERADVFIASDLLWYPIQGDNKSRTAPDLMIAFGRPKGHRGSYRQWEEDGIPPTFVIEILSPGNRMGEMSAKAVFYERHGVLEYLIYDPDEGSLEVLTRDESGSLVEQDVPNGWQSELTGVRFFVDETNLIAVRPDGKPFESYLETIKRANQESKRANQESQRANEAEAEMKRLRQELEALRQSKA